MVDIMITGYLLKDIFKSYTRAQIMFDLFFTSEGRMFGEAGYNGSIKIGNFSENFFSNNIFFNARQYQEQWLAAAERVLSNGKSYFLVNVYDPDMANFFTSWPCSVIDGTVYIQNQIIFADQYCLSDILSFQTNLGEIEFIDEDGEKFSTWQTDLHAMQQFRTKMRHLLA
ncbi:hypothetical protein B0W47_01430 [Komagataeibacter nataicola]|uniref:CdiI C-terminal domain-containing protein n=3 Tax=Komagataeibacter nataicola TaxID=265960 RepID=A0A9N7C683_9PROT|nr:hypothetical protein [Komagataeibacter nataicola]AQU86332.1 hypothetical protein B0W47_01430 [Komagataeibacter nataicola]PYD66572.1 hypothetical protein CDI09_07590 [Komagataeibacter nataicola]